MHPLVQAYLNKKAEEAQKKKNELLIKLNLYEKEYGSGAPEYPDCETDDNGTLKWFKKIPVEISDEEYSEILKYDCACVDSNESPIASVFKGIAVFVFTGGFFAGIFLGRDSWGDFNFLLALAYWAAFFVAGMFHFALAEIIQLLTDIKTK